MGKGRVIGVSGRPAAENWSRFVIELAQALADEIGEDRVGIRFSPAMSWMSWVQSPLWPLGADRTLAASGLSPKNYFSGCPGKASSP